MCVAPDLSIMKFPFLPGIGERLHSAVEHLLKMLSMSTKQVILKTYSYQTFWWQILHCQEIILSLRLPQETLRLKLRQLSPSWKVKNQKCGCAVLNFSNFAKTVKWTGLETCKVSIIRCQGQSSDTLQIKIFSVFLLIWGKAKIWIFLHAIWPIWSKLMPYI